MPAPGGRAMRRRPRAARAASSECLPRYGRPQEREVGVQMQSAAQKAVPRGVVTEATLDHPAVEELERVERAQAKCSSRVAECLGAASVACECPCEDVVAVDARPVGS